MLLCFNSRTLGRVRLVRKPPGQKNSMFQFTHPGKGATYLERYLIAFPWRFQFTHPGKGATGFCHQLRSHCFVSIHAPWEGCDLRYSSHLRACRGFNSRTLGRVRLNTQARRMAKVKFQFTHPGKGATSKSHHLFPVI